MSDREKRFREIIASYEDSGFASQQESGPRDVILVVGEDFAPACELLGTVFGRRVVRASSLDHAMASGQLLGASSILAVAPRRALGLEAIRRLLKVDHPAAMLGVLPATDLVALDFAIRKIGLTRCFPLGRRFLWHVEANKLLLPNFTASEPIAPLEALMRPSGIAVIGAHGEGAHLLLRGAVLCGRVGCTEEVQGEPVSNGCATGHCKRAAGLPSVHVAQIPSIVLALLSCNSFSVAGELYPSNSSLVMAAMEGWAAAVIANPAAVPCPPITLRYLSFLIESGLALGEVTARLNHLYARDDAFVLVGDPLARGVCAEPPADRFAAIETHTDPPVEVYLGGSPARLVSGIVPSLVVGLPKESDDMPRIESRSDAARAVRAWHDHLQAQIDTASYMDLQICERLLQSDDESGALDLRSTTIRLRQQVADGAALVSSMEASLLWNSHIDEWFASTRDFVGGWDERVAAAIRHHYLGSGPVGDEVLSLLTHHLVQHRRTLSPERCHRCGTPIERVDFGILSRPRQSLEECPICGPVRCAAPSALRMALACPATAVRGGVMHCSLRCEGASTALRDASGWLIHELRDKSTGRREQSIRRWEAAESVYSFRISDDAGFDQHSLRLVIVSQLEIAYARAVFSVVPTTARA